MVFAIHDRKCQSLLVRTFINSEKSVKNANSNYKSLIITKELSICKICLINGTFLLVNLQVFYNIENSTLYPKSSVKNP